MKILFGKYFEGGAYPGTTPKQPCLFGEVRTGPGGLLRILETHLGLSGRFPPSSVRAAALTKVLEKTPGFWSESFREAPMAVAARLLDWREELNLHSPEWEKASPRLAQLFKVTEPFSKEFQGPSDRLQRVIVHLNENPVPISQFTLFEPEETFPALWRVIFMELSNQGVPPKVLDRPKVTRHGDLLHCCRKPFTPKGDGSLQVLKTYGPCEAAENLSAWLSSQVDDLEGTVIIGSDPVLDEALNRFGLPTLGAEGDPTENSLLGILPLIVECGWNPPDPAKVLELLSLPVTPVPPFLAGPLADCLSEWPAVGSHLWRETIEERLGKVAGDGDPKLHERLRTIFTSPIDREKPFPAEELEKRVQLVESWAHGRMKDAKDIEAWAALLRQCEDFRRLVSVSGRKGFSESHLLSILEQASSDLQKLPRRPQCAGLTYIGHPGALIGPARRTIWWNFTAAGTAWPRVFPATSEERKRIKENGTGLVSAGDLMVQEAGFWRLPFSMTSETLILVIPQTGIGGEETFPHPVWDEIVANTPDPKVLEPLFVTVPRSEKPLKASRRALRSLPTPRLDWVLPRRVSLPERKESVSSISTFIRCPFQYLVKYLGKAYPGRSAALPGNWNLLGNLIHFLVAEFLRGRKSPSRKDDWKTLADKLFKERAPFLAAPFFLPGGEVWRTKAQRALSHALEVIRNLKKNLDGFASVRVEKEITGKAFGGEFCGKPDVVLTAPAAVVDLKWSSQKHRIKELRDGTCTQLAGYCALLQREMELEGFPPAAFLILQSGNLLTTSREDFPDAMKIEGPPLLETWRAMEKAFSTRKKMLEARNVLALGNQPAEMLADDDRLDAQTGELSLVPGCDDCSYGHLCGRAFGGQR